MSQFRDKAADARVRRASRTNTFKPKVESNLYQNYYLWYYKETKKSIPGNRKIGRCMYHIVIATAMTMKVRRKAFHALGNNVVRAVLAVLVAAAIIIGAILENSVLTGLMYAGVGLMGGGYLTAGIVYAVTLAKRAKTGKWAIKIKGDEYSNIDIALCAFLLGLVFLPFTILTGVALVLSFIVGGIARVTNQRPVDVVFGLGYGLIGLYILFMLYLAFASSWVITLIVIACVVVFALLVVAAFYAIDVIVENREQKREAEKAAAEQKRVQEYLDSPEVDEALRLIFSKICPDRANVDGAYEQWKPRYLRHYTSWVTGINRAWMPYAWRLDAATYAQMVLILNPDAQTEESIQQEETPSVWENVIEFVTFLWELAKNLHSRTCALMELPEEPQKAEAVNLTKK